MEKIYIFDISSLVFRYHFALKEEVDIDGLQNGGVFGVFFNTIRVLSRKKGTKIIWVFDGAKNNFRKLLLPSYKQNRGPVDLSIISQLAKVKTYAEEMSIPFCIHDIYEADDLMASLVEKYKLNYIICIIGNDKDLYQLVEDERVYIWNFAKKKEKTITESIVKETLGVKPMEVGDLLALWGDSSDNISGIKRIGKETAKKLILKYGNMEAIIENEKNKYDFSNIELNKKLVNLVKDIEIPFESIKDTEYYDFLNFIEKKEILIFNKLLNSTFYK